MNAFLYFPLPRMIRRLAAMLVVLPVLCLPATALAHKVNTFAYAEDNLIHVEGFFSDGKVADNAEIQVFSPDGERVAQGQADGDGIFTFDIPDEITDLRVSLYAGMGHRAEFTLPADEVRAGIVSSSDNATSGAEEDGGTGTTVSSEAMESMIRQAVNEAVTPLSRNIAELNQQRTFSDIIGGIGFIVGIIGVFFYLKARRMGGRTSSTGAGG